jgi:hypothetical protein
MHDMVAYKSPDFNERTALARAAREKALDQLRSRPAPDEALLAERHAARIAREEAAEEKRRAKRLAEEQAREARRAEAALADDPKTHAAPVPRNEAELKIARDARYAARKNRKG